MTTNKSTHSRRSTRKSHNGHAKKDIRTEAEQLFYDALEEVKGKTEGVRGVVTDYVKERPLKSLGVALATGVVLALLFRR